MRVNKFSVIVPVKVNIVIPASLLQTEEGRKAQSAALAIVKAASSYRIRRVKDKKTGKLKQIQYFAIFKNPGTLQRLANALHAPLSQ